MLVTSKTTSPTAFSSLAFAGGGRVRPLTIVRRAGVRGLRLTVDPRDAQVRLTLPPRAALTPAVAWAAGKRAWVEAALERLPQPQPIVPGMCFGLSDRLVTLDWREDRRHRISFEDDVLAVGGPIELLTPRVLRWLRAHALATLERETRALAARHGIVIARVGVGDQRGRWGSCSASGDLRYSWRLILAPAHVLTATVAHEVAHRVHMNHAPAFHALAAELNGGDPAPARAWLRTHGTALHWFGRSG